MDMNIYVIKTFESGKKLIAINYATFRVVTKEQYAYLLTKYTK